MKCVVGWGSVVCGVVCGVWYNCVVRVCVYCKGTGSEGGSLSWGGVGWGVRRAGVGAQPVHVCLL